MTIEKNGKYYEASEWSRYWLVALKLDTLTVDFQVSKDICETEAELKEYIEKKEIF